jgi:hypothetical protein
LYFLPKSFEKRRESTMATDGRVASWTATEILGHPRIQHTDSAEVNTVLQKRRGKGRDFSSGILHKKKEKNGVAS